MNWRTRKRLEGKFLPEVSAVTLIIKLRKCREDFFSARPLRPLRLTKTILGIVRLDRALVPLADGGQVRCLNGARGEACFILRFVT